jgi:phosphoribosyl-ATP pyrophosphohydrolase
MARKPGYHIKKIKRGTIGESDKILEEILELIDAEKQNCRVMVIIELSDIIGAISAYIDRYGLRISLKDLEIMSEITKRAFKNGHRR